MVILTKYNIDTYKPVPVVNIPPMRFIGGLTRQGRTVSIHGSWEPEISVAVITTVGVPVEEALDDIGMKAINVVINMECDGEAYWVKSLGELWTTQSVDQWVVWITNPSSVEEVPNTDWLISVLPFTKKNDRSPDPGIKSWEQPLNTLRDLLKKSCNLKESLVFCPYRCLDEVK